MIEITFNQQRQRYEAVTVPRGHHVILKDCGWRWDKDRKTWFTPDPMKARFKHSIAKPDEGAG